MNLSDPTPNEVQAAIIADLEAKLSLASEREFYIKAENARLRAEVERQSRVNAEVVGEASRQVAASDNLFREARAEVERWKTVAAEMSQQREHNANERDRADAEVAAFKKLLLEFGQLTEGVINGGDCREKILYIHVPCEPRGYMVGQPVKVILPAAEAAMKGTK